MTGRGFQTKSKGHIDRKNIFLNARTQLIVTANSGYHLLDGQLLHMVREMKNVMFLFNLNK